MKVRKFLLSSLLAILFCFPFVLNVNMQSSELSDCEVADDSIMFSSYESNLTLYDNFLQAYYDSLTYNFGLNYKGSCGYVALGMLLSYYDTYLNDNIIPEQYDVASTGSDTNIKDRHNSPGTLKDNVRFEDNIEYYNALNSLSDSCLHAQLVNIGVANNFCNIDTAYYGTTLAQRICVLNNYFSNVIGYNEHNQYEIEYLNHENDYTQYSDTVREYIVSKIQAGYPVLIGIAHSNTKVKHACIAYDYCPDTDSIYCHMGWGASTTHVTIESQDYKYYRSAMTINFNVAHTHSNNYVINGKTYCYCTDEVEIYHKHNYTLENTNNQIHTKTCSCGLVKTENHSLTYQSKSSTIHVGTCSCGHREEGNHLWTPIPNPFLSLLGLDEDYIDPLYISPTKFYKCVICGYVKEVSSGEIVPVVPDF